MYWGGGKKKVKQNLRGLKKTIDLANIKMQKVKDRVLRADGQLAHSVGQHLISKVLMLITSMLTKKDDKGNDKEGGNDDDKDVDKDVDKDNEEINTSSSSLAPGISSEKFK